MQRPARRAHEPWPLPVVAASAPVTEGAATRLVHDDGAVQILSWACRADCAALRAERTHSHHVISILRRGACTVRQAGRTVTVDPAAILVHRPGATYHTRHPWGFVDAGWSLAYDDAVASEVLDVCGSARKAWPPSRLVRLRGPRELAGVFAALCRIEAGAPADPLVAQGAALHLLACVHDPDAFAWSASHPARAAERALVDRACESLRARMADPVRLTDVARDCGVSEFRLYRAFRRQRGATPGAVLRDLRVAAVLDALSRGARSLADVALDAGFASHSHMTATFTRHVGGTPGGLRRAMRPSAAA